MSAIDAPELDRLRDRLAVTAAAAGLIDVGYRVVDSPIGPLLVAATDRGVVRVAFAAEGFSAVLQELADRVGARVLRAPARLDPAARQLEEYFAGRRRRFDLPLDLGGVTGFRREVLDGLAGIGYGATVSYGGLAAGVGRPRAVRAVGTACGANPVPVLLPCHRVVRGDGSPGHYRGGDAAKQQLLALEQLALEQEVARCAGTP